MIVRHDRFWYRNPDGSLVKDSRHEAMRKSGQFGGDMTYPATAKYGSESVQLTREWWDYIRSINTPQAWEALRRVNGGWLNSAGTNREVFGGGNTVPDDTSVFPKCEPVTSVGNEVNVLEVKNGRARIEVLDVRQSPRNITPQSHPHLFCRFTSISETGQIGLAPNGIESYFPLLSHNGVGWLDMEQLEETKEVNMRIIDISYFQSHQRNGEPVEDYAYVDFDLVSEYADAVILRAAYGMWTDPEYLRNRQELELRGVPLNAYGWCLPSHKPEAQGAYVGELTKGLTTVWLDIETVPRANYGILPLDHYLRFWDAFDKVNPNSRKGIYLNLDAANQLPDDPRLLQFPLWLAAFGLNDGNIPNWPNGPIVPKPWARYDMWQYTDKGKILGIDGSVDMNVLHPTVTLEYLFGTPPIVVDPLPLTLEERVIKLEAENAARRREISALAASIITITKPVSDPVVTPVTGKKYRVVEPTTMFIADKGQLRQVKGMKLPEGHVIGIGTIQNWKAELRGVALYGKVTSAPLNDQLGLWVNMKDLKVVV